MLSDSDVIATVAVKDTKAAAQFYEGKLGLERQDSPEPTILLYRGGSGKLLVYPSQFSSTNEATSVTWIVGDVDREVQALKEKGVTFERYEMPNVTHEGDVHVMGKRRSAWFKDPDGNIHALASRD